MNPPFEPTSTQRLTVSIMTACGAPQTQIIEKIVNERTGAAIDLKTLRKAFRREIKDAQVSANAMVAQSLFKKATGTGHQSVAAAIFWLKTRAGWKETFETAEIPAPVKVIIQVQDARLRADDAELPSADPQPAAG